MRNPSFCALSILFMLAGGASARVIYVDRGITLTTADGKSWSTAFPAIPAAIQAAAAGDEIWVAAGTYAGNLLIDKPVALYGGFVGTETYRDQRLGIPSLTVIDGAYRTPCVTVRSGAVNSPPAVVDGFTIRNGLSAGYGGGVSLQTGKLILTHNIVTSNYAEPMKGTGGGICCQSGAAATIAGNIITANSSQSGSAIYASNAAVYIVNNTIVGNAGAAGAVAVTNAPTSLLANNIIAFNVSGISEDAARIVRRHNCVHGNIGGDYVSAGSKPGPDDIDSDPALADYGAGNLHIQPDSPCRDAGDDALAAAGDTDVDLQPRLQGAHVDIGADESDGRQWLPTPRRVFHVSPKGARTNDGLTWATATNSVQSAVDAAAASGGGEVWVAAGSYALTQSAAPLAVSILVRPYVYLYGGFAGTESTRDQRNLAANPTFLAGSRAAAGSVAGLRVSSIDGFIFYGSTTQYASMLGVNCSGGSPYIRNNVFLNINGAVSMIGSAAVFENNAVVGGTAKVPTAVEAQASTPTIVGNLVTGTRVSSGSSLSAIRAYYCPAGRIANNLLDANAAVTPGSPFAAMSLERSEVDVVNNTVVNSPGAALRLMIQGRMSIMNNILAFCDFAITPVLASPYVTARGNCIYPSSVEQGTLPPILAGGGNILAYPMFADLLNEDYHLLPMSPCVDFGDDSAVLPGELDLDGLPRIQGLHVDAGCYESAATGTERKWSDVAAILRIAGGLAPASAAQADAYQMSGANGLTIQDAIALARALKAMSR
ncbi:MAG TPA: right-handed parallel beta-helix repeat-containing protein [Armatimonadota bacterium]